MPRRLGRAVRKLAAKTAIHSTEKAVSSQIIAQLFHDEGQAGQVVFFFAADEVGHRFRFVAIIFQAEDDGRMLQRSAFRFI